VWWLIAAFVYGVVNLTSVLNLGHDQGNSNWTFGQIVPIILLAAPALAAVEFLMGRYSLMYLRERNIYLTTYYYRQTTSRREW
jgi:hypothetical protein